MDIAHITIFNLARQLDWKKSELFGKSGCFEGDTHKCSSNQPSSFQDNLQRPALSKCCWWDVHKEDVWNILLKHCSWCLGLHDHSTVANDFLLQDGDTCVLFASPTCLVHKGAFTKFSWPFHPWFRYFRSHLWECLYTYLHQCASSQHHVQMLH